MSAKSLVFSRSLPSAWSNLAMTMRTKQMLTLYLIDDLGYITLEFLSRNPMEMDINWQIAMIAIRMKKFYKKTGRRVRVDGKTPVGFDKKKLECFNCHNTGHFARECTAKGTHDGKKKRDSFYQHQEAGKQEKNQMGLLTMDDGIVNWGEHTEVEETNHALMAISSSNEVSLCSKTCIDSYNTLKTLCDEQMNQLGDQEAQILAYSQAVKKLEAQLVTFQKQQLSLNEKLTFQANEIYEKDEKLKRYRRIGMKAVKEKEQLQKTLDSWKDSSKNLWRLINSGMSSNSKVGLGFEIQSNNEVLSYEEEMNFSVFNCSKEDSVGKPLYSRFTKTNDFKGVPHPLSGDYTPTPQEEIDESLYVYGKKGPQEPEPNVSDDRSSEYSTCQSNDSAGSIGTSSEHSVDPESEISSVPPEVYVSTPITTNEKGVSDPKSKEVEPSCVSHIKTPRQPIKDQATPKVNRKNWNAIMERELGEDCDYYEKKMAKEVEFKKQRIFNTGNRVAKPVWTNANRVNHVNQFVPRSVQLNAGRPNINSVRPNIIRRPFAKTTTQMSHSHAVKGNWGSAVKTSAGYNWRNSKPNSNCDSGPTFIRTVNAKGPQGRPKPKKAWVNKDQLEDFEEFNGGSVTFGGSKGYISGKGKIRVGNLDFDSVSFVKELGHFNLFSISQICDKQHKVPRHHNMYSFDMKTHTPTKGFACLIDKATSNESKLWHRREPKNISEALQDDSWVQAMQEELLQFKLQQVWFLVESTSRNEGGLTKVALTKDEEAVDVDVHLYRSMIGSLMYLTASRPDINVKRNSMDLQMFAEIVDFLRGSNLRYALTTNPTIYDSLVKQFGQLATASEGGRAPHRAPPPPGGTLLADGTLEGQATLIPLWIFYLLEQLFTTQWSFSPPYLHCISSKSGGWDQFGSNIATALICLSTGRYHLHLYHQNNLHHLYLLLSLASTPIPIPETDPEPMEHTFEEPSPAHQHFSPPQEHVQGQMTLDDLLQVVPQLMTRVDSLEKDLKQTKLTMGSAIVKLVKKVKKLEGILKRRNVVLSDSEEESKAQGRKSQMILYFFDSKDDDPISEDELEKILWEYLKNTFEEPLSTDPVWSSLEKKYPLTAEVCKAMLDKKLQGGKPDEDCYKLLKWMEKQAGIRKIRLDRANRLLVKTSQIRLIADNLPNIVGFINTPYLVMAYGKDKLQIHIRWLTLYKKVDGAKGLTSPEQTATGEGISNPFMAIMVCQKPYGVNTLGSDENSLKLYDLIADMKGC
ncbi:ribonuclease H-like domain-containing protein [Tanacetum coccineum]